MNLTHKSQEGCAELWGNPFVPLVTELLSFSSSVKLLNELSYNPKHKLSSRINSLLQRRQKEDCGAFCERPVPALNSRAGSEIRRNIDQSG